MDFGSSVYQSYWVTAIKADVVDQPWVADGIFTDDCVAMPPQVGYSATSVKYPTDTAFSAGMNSFVSAISTGLHGFGQKLWCNKGETRSAIGSAAWRALDASASPPDVFLEEGAFAVMWGPWAVQFTQESEWKNQIDTMAALKNTKAAMLSHTQLVEGQSGSDNFGNTVSFWQILWYSLGSYLLGKNDVLGNAYFMFHGGDSDYNKIIWYNEYDNIDLGKALGSYAVTTIGGVNIYSREFEKGYVYVNPTGNVASVALPQGGRQLTHDNLLSPLTSLPLVSSISLSGHSAGIVLKTDWISRLPRRHLACNFGSRDRISEHQPRSYHHLLLHRSGYRRGGQRFRPIGFGKRDHSSRPRYHPPFCPQRAHRNGSFIHSDQSDLECLNR